MHFICDCNEELCEDCGPSGAADGCGYFACHGFHQRLITSLDWLLMLHSGSMRVILCTWRLFAGLDSARTLTSLWIRNMQLTWNSYFCNSGILIYSYTYRGFRKSAFDSDVIETGTTYSYILILLKNPWWVWFNNLGAWKFLDVMCEGITVMEGLFFWVMYYSLNVLEL